MRTNKHYILALLLLLFAAPFVAAQYGYGSQYGRQRQRSAIPRGPEPKRETKPLTAEEIVANEMPKLTEALELNEFEQAVVSSILNKYMQQRIELQLLELDADKTRESLEKIIENQKAELKAGLSEEKYNALLAYQKNGLKKMKRKKKKDKKKKKSDG